MFELVGAAKILALSLINIELVSNMVCLIKVILIQQQELD